MTALTRQQQRAIAIRLLTQHDHKGYQRDVLTRENCGTCALHGYHSAPRYGGDGRPNYAGWLRIYIQAGKTPNAAAVVAELAEAKAGNVHYYNAILDDVRHYGCPLKGHWATNLHPHDNVCPLCQAVKDGDL